MRILLVEDDPHLGAAVAQALAQSYAVDWMRDGVDALAALDAAQYDALVLDLSLPKLSGQSVLRHLRAQRDARKSLPVLLMTALGGIDDRVEGLDAGADDYLVKPFALPELLARVRSLVRRRHAAQSNALQYGALQFDLESQQASVGGEALRLSQREARVLELLLLRVGRPISKERLSEALCGWDAELSPNAIEVHVHRLRKKLEPFGVALDTFRGLGYCLRRPEGEAVAG